jgi:hypothetical protein
MSQISIQTAGDPLVLRLFSGVLAAARRNAAALLGVLLVLSLLAGIHVGTTSLISTGENYAKAWMGTLTSSLPPHDKPAVHANLVDGSASHDRLLQQLAQIRGRLSFHREVTLFFYSRYYMALTAALIAGLLSGAMLATILRVGWQNAGSPVKITLLIAAGATAYFAAFPGLFRQQENISENAALYLAYSNLENDIHTYLATGMNAEGEPVTLPALVHHVNGRMAALNSIPIGFDATKLPVAREAFREVAEMP